LLVWLRATKSVIEAPFARPRQLQSMSMLTTNRVFTITYPFLYRTILMDKSFTYVYHAIGQPLSGYHQTFGPLRQPLTVDAVKFRATIRH
jgi:hypothetical protein